jgi:hypothetical protein
VGGLGSDGRSSTVSIPLPEGAVGIAFSENDPAGRYIVGDGELRDTTPVRPGQETMLVFFSYHLPVDEQTVHVERTYDYDIAMLSVLLAQPGLSLTAGPLNPQGSTSFQDKQYEQYAAVDLPAGTPLAFDLAVSATDVAAPGQPDVPAGPAPKDNQAVLGTIGFILAGLVLAAALGYGLAARPVKAARPAAALDSDPRARALLAEVAGLDEAFEAGRLDEDTYRRERAAKMEAIRAL